MAQNDKVSVENLDIQACYDAVKQLYYAAYWKADRHVVDNVWEKVRDAFGFEPGKSFELLGESCFPEENA